MFGEYTQCTLVGAKDINNVTAVAGLSASGATIHHDNKIRQVRFAGNVSVSAMDYTLTL